MRTQSTSGSFITLIRAFLAKAKEISDAASNADTESFPFHPRVDTVANLLVLQLLSRNIQERRAEEDRPAARVFRYSSSNSCAPACTFPGFGRR